MIQPSNFHTPVLLSQVISALFVAKGKKYIDATLGGGGYTDEILKRGGIVLGIDRDWDAIEYVRGKHASHENLNLVQGNFADLKKIAHSKGFTKVAGIIFDLGMSSYQLEGSGRGFSYKEDEPLDMRMDQKQELTAAKLLNNYSKEKLYEIFTKYAEELHSGAIAEAIVRARSVKGEITQTEELLEIIESVLEKIYFRETQFSKLKIFQRTKARIFQALRIAVNSELENLRKGLVEGVDLLGIGGRFAVLSYHSLEDRIVKLTFRKLQEKQIIKNVTADFARADKKEQEENSKAKPAKLRLVERIA